MQTLIIIIIILLLIFLYLYVKYDYIEPSDLVKDIILYIRSLYYDALGYKYISVLATDVYNYKEGDDIIIRNEDGIAHYYKILLIAPDRKYKKIYIKPKKGEHDLVY